MIIPELSATTRAIAAAIVIGGVVAIWPVCWVLDQISAWRANRIHRWRRGRLRRGRVGSD